jgi:hypothetical protein
MPSSLRCNRCGCLRGGSSTSARADHSNLSFRHPQDRPSLFGRVGERRAASAASPGEPPTEAEQSSLSDRCRRSPRRSGAARRSGRPIPDADRSFGERCLGLRRAANAPSGSGKATKKACVSTSTPPCAANASRNTRRRSSPPRPQPRLTWSNSRRSVAIGQRQECSVPEAVPDVAAASGLPLEPAGRLRPVIAADSHRR